MATCRLQHMVNVWNIEFLCSNINACRMLTDTPSVSFTWCEECYFIKYISLNIEPISCELNWKPWFTITLARLEALYTFLWKICPFCRSFGISRDSNHPVANAQKYHSGTGHFIICFLVGVGHFHVFEFIQYAHAVKNVTLFVCRLNRKIVDWKRWRKSTQSFIFG